METNRSRTRARARPRIVVLGGGFGGLEAALYLRARLPDPDHAEIMLVSDQDYFLFKPNTIYIPFGLDPGKVRLSLSKPAHRRHISLTNATARDVDPVSKWICLDRTNQISNLSYDYLVVATGAGADPTAVPGLREFGITMWSTDDMLRLRAAFQLLLADAKKGRTRKVLFLIPPNNMCTGPLYEMVLMLDSWLRRKRVRDLVELTWSTFEERYIQVFGARMHQPVAQEFEHRGIKGYTRYAVDRIEKGEAVYKNGERLPFDILVAFPARGAAVHFTHLPVDERGFIATDLKTRQVVGYPDAYAVGDASDFPLKQANLSILQADAAADHIAARLLGGEPASAFDPVRMYGTYAREMATLAQMSPGMASSPGGSEGHGLEVPLNFDLRPGASDLYEAGSSPIWRLGKMAMGLYLPWRFKAGNPFHSGVPWKGMEAELKLLSGGLAR